MTLADEAAVDPHLGELLHLHASLLEATRAWARGAAPGPQVAADRRRAHELNHLRYAERVPVYHDLAEARGLLGPQPLETIVDELLLLDVFKGYDPGWVAGGGFEALTRWLGTVFTRRPEPSLDGVRDLGGWRTRLRAEGVFLSFSSATSGRLSFVPRDLVTWRALCGNGAAYTDEGWRQAADGTLAPYDCLVAGPRGGGLGILDAGAGLARTAARSHFLFDEVLGPDEVLRGASALVGDGDEAYARAFSFLEVSAAEGRRLLVFGAPFQVRRFCERVAASRGRLPTAPGSLVVTGGGWKSFRGEQLPRAALARLVRDTLGIPASACVDAYSTSELNVTLRTCAHGRYHVPPLVEAVILDEALTGVPGRAGTGALAFLDPFAVSYPGFVITGDEATLSVGTCGCGLHGPFLDGEIRRASGLELRGCGGVLESMAV